MPLALALASLGLASEDSDDFFFFDFELLLLLLLCGVVDNDVVGDRVVGDSVGAVVVGDFVGEFEGVSVGAVVVGDFVGDFVGVLVGERLVLGADVSPFSDLLFFDFLLDLLDFEEGVGNIVIGSSVGGVRSCANPGVGKPVDTGREFCDAVGSLVVEPTTGDIVGVFV